MPEAILSPLQTSNVTGVIDYDMAEVVSLRVMEQETLGEAGLGGKKEQAKVKVGFPSHPSLFTLFHFHLDFADPLPLSSAFEPHFHLHPAAKRRRQGASPLYLARLIPFATKQPTDTSLCSISTPSNAEHLRKAAAPPLRSASQRSTATSPVRERRGGCRDRESCSPSARKAPFRS